MKTITFLLILTVGLLAAVVLDTAPILTNVGTDRPAYKRAMDSGDYYAADANGTLVVTSKMWLSSVIVTNWHEWDNSPKRIDPQFYIGDYPPPQATYGCAIGEVRSNAVLNVLFGGKTNQIEQASTILGFIRRDWKLKPAERETTEQPFTPAKSFQKVMSFGGQPEITYFVESTNLTIHGNAAAITNAYWTNLQFVIRSNVWK